MADPFTEAEKPTPLARKPTEYLTRVSIENLSPLGVFLLAKEGFALSDVYSMVSLSELYLSWNVIKRIVGKPSRTMQGKNDKTTTGRLGVFESAIAFQYAKVLEHAMTVFGTLRLAEEWLAKPCRYLDGNIPLDLVGNPLGFQAVEDYLERVELGVYQ